MIALAPTLGYSVVELTLASSMRLLREALHATLDGVPFAMNIEQIGVSLAKVSGVREVHDLHVWISVAERLAISGHMRFKYIVDWAQTLKDLTEVAGKLGIGHVAFQPESVMVAQQITLIRK